MEEKEERKEYFEELGIEPKKVEEHDKKEDGVDVIDDDDEEKKEERREEELEQYREVSGF